jgi:hypothetical protein
VCTPYLSEWGPNLDIDSISISIYLDPPNGVSADGFRVTGIDEDRASDSSGCSAKWVPQSFGGNKWGIL